MNTHVAWACPTPTPQGGLAYYFIYLPEQRKIEERKVGPSAVATVWLPEYALDFYAERADGAAHR